jgi:hypothetical protein
MQTVLKVLKHIFLIDKMSEHISTIIGYVLFAISEILPLINIQTNGFIQSFTLGLTNAFKAPDCSDTSKLLNSLMSNKQVLDITKHLLENPFDANNATIIQKDDQISEIVSMMNSNVQLKNAIVKFTHDTELYTSIVTVLQDKHLVNNLLILQHNDSIKLIVDAVYKDKKLFSKVYNTVLESNSSQ